MGSNARSGYTKTSDRNKDLYISVENVQIALMISSGRSDRFGRLGELVAALYEHVDASVLAAKAAAVDPVFLDLVADDAFGGVEERGRLPAIPARRLERILKEIALVCGHRLSQRDGREGRWEMVPMDDV